MALSSQEKHDVVRVLGWSGATIVEGSKDFNTVVNDRLDGLSSESELSARALLTRLANLDIKLEKALCRVSTVRIGDIELNPDELRHLRKERIRIIRELSQVTAIAFVGAGSSNTVNICL
jgi:hypothetical protein